MASCLHITLRAHRKSLVPGLTPYVVPNNFSSIKMLDLHFPTTVSHTLILSRYTEPNLEQQLLVDRLMLTSPP